MRWTALALLGILGCGIEAPGSDAGLDAPAADAGCARDADCDDGLFCNGQERCRGGICADGPPPACGDPVECTIDRCVEATRRWLADYGLEADLRAVPLRPAPCGWPGLWYDHGDLPGAIDLMLIDGPPWSIHPMTRGAAATLFDHIASGGTVLLDDAARPGERLVARRWRRMRPDFDFRLWKGGTKGTLIGTRRR